jgi:hypothetical protein
MVTIAPAPSCNSPESHDVRLQPIATEKLWSVDLAQGTLNPPSPIVDKGIQDVIFVVVACVCSRPRSIMTNSSTDLRNPGLFESKVDLRKTGNPKGVELGSAGMRRKTERETGGNKAVEVGMRASI